MRITWLGHACFLLEGERLVIIDPYVPGGPIAREPDLVAVTHGHDDHLGEVIRLGKKTIAITEIGKYLRAKGLPVETMNLGGTIEVDGVEFTMTPAVHSSGLGSEGPGFLRRVRMRLRRRHGRGAGLPCRRYRPLLGHETHRGALPA